LGRRQDFSSGCRSAIAIAGYAQQLTIITSFPKDLTEVYKKAFESRNPGVRVEVLNRGTSSAIAFVREAPAGNRPDVFWASAPDAFEVLSKEKLLEKFPGANPAVPAKIGNYPINDPDGFYYGQALAGYGLMWNTRYLKANKVPAPREWADLVKPEYFGHLAISAPSRSGTTHLTIETILQGEGWEKGWNQILQFSGNCAAITERSFGVPDGVNNGQFGIGLVIDFFGLSAKASGFPVEFVYPSVTAIVPANIGLVSGGRSSELGKKFIAFALSEEGQQLLLEPRISRLPVLPAVYKKAPQGYPNPYGGKIQAKVQFDSDLSRSRYYLVNSLYDHTIIGYVASVIMVAASLFALWASTWIMRGKEYATLQRGYAGLSRRRLTPGQSVLAYAWIGLVLLIVLAPHLGILLLSFASVWSFSVVPDGYTLSHYATVFQDSPLMIWNTALYCGIAATLDVVIATAIAYLMLRTRIPGRQALDFTVTIALAIPGVVLGIGYLRTFRGIEIPFTDDLLTSSWVLLALAYTVRRLPYALRSCVAALQQLHVSLEEAAENLGATKGRTIRRVVVPLMTGGMMAGFVISFMTAAVELSTTLMLVTAQHDAPMSYGIYLYMQSAAGRGPGAALGVLAVLLVAAGTYASYRLIGSRGNIARAQEIQTMGV